MTSSIRILTQRKRKVKEETQDKKEIKERNTGKGIRERDKRNKRQGTRPRAGIDKKKIIRNPCKVMLIL